MKTDMEALPARMRDLPVDPERQLVVPWFVAWLDGKPEFRAMDGVKWIRAIREHLCWVCGERLGVWQIFVMGPMCGITRTTPEPPCHQECARWSARHLPEAMGVTLLWTTRRFEILEDGAGKPLIHIGDAESVEWWAEGRQSTREEVDHAVDTGMPFVAEMAKGDRAKVMVDLMRRKWWLERMYPRAAAGMEA